tara:strand:+ start:495 stop:653 length:159 start_codon:yes stop_codon:yes gene_type:complete
MNFLKNNRYPKIKILTKNNRHTKKTQKNYANFFFQGTNTRNHLKKLKFQGSA